MNTQQIITREQGDQIMQAMLDLHSLLVDDFGVEHDQDMHFISTADEVEDRWTLVDDFGLEPEQVLAAFNLLSKVRECREQPTPKPPTMADLTTKPHWPFPTH